MITYTYAAYSGEKDWEIKPIPLLIYWASRKS
jgi:hypothetical protein